ncbi:uncharacterized protein EHS24_000957 [Apiotrichum porosum]|jgi:putative intracellular protease/amidase|uniref:D-lactate dehydratase n=1 Tax=Apiotrichum porosum TaxID=105984 RepID=A0A427YBE7_9TREE|nr:uncharacterized protein EHS24_000957 [Apiotrichum porosum]RSH88412.1 hypothetical protein EHS24_000957 [Apiotrichum porosum]
MSPTKRALIAITSAHVDMYGEGKETGLFVTEALHPFNVLREAGFEVDLASETGTYVPDWLSTTEDWLPAEDRKVFEDHTSEFRSKLDNLHKASDLKASDYGLFFASAGHASLIDYPTAKSLQAIASEVYTNGGVVSAVCHGGAIFLGINDKNGRPIIEGKTVTGFTNLGEEQLGHVETIKNWHVPTIEASAAQLGANYVAPPGPWDSFTQTDGRVVTGANPASAEATAKAALAVFNTL